MRRLVDEGGIAVVRRSRLSANTSAVDGGGIYAAGSLTVEDSVITGNGGRYGGGISARGAAISLSNSSFVGNRAEYGAGVMDVTPPIDRFSIDLLRWHVA